MCNLAFARPAKCALAQARALWRKGQTHKAARTPKPKCYQMRVLHVFKGYKPDDFTGIPRVIDAIGSEAIALGVEVQVLTLSAEPAKTQPIQIEGQTIWQSKQQLVVDSTGISVPALFKYRKLLRGVDVVHYHHPWPLQDVMHLLPGPVPPSVVTYHADVMANKLWPIYKWLLRAFLRRVDRVVATSPIYAQTSPILARYTDKLSVIPIGITPEREVDAARVQAWRDRLGAGFMLFVGAHRKYKGLPFLYEAARMSGLPVVVAGGQIGPPPEDLPDNITLLGRIDDADKEALLELCGALVLPSHRRAEAFGVVLLEAMRAEKPIITCEIGSGMSYVNQNEETGLIVPPEDGAALAAAMAKLSQSPERARQMGAAGRKRFEQLFVQETMGKAYLRLYQELLKS